jgi:hypothetical protein
MKRYSTSHVTKKLCEKNEIYPCTPIRMAKFKTLSTLNAGEDVHQWELSFFSDGNENQYSYFGRLLVSFLYKFLQYDPSITLLHIYPK